MAGAPARVPVWDAGVRLLHWLLAASVAWAWLSSTDAHGRWHALAGYIAAAVVLARLGWGVACGRRSARLARSLRFARAALAHARELAHGAGRRYLGHNPLGSVMVLALLACTAATSFTGWLFTTDRFWGYRWLSSLHNALAWLLLALIVLHVTGVVWTSRRQRENLVRAMLTGSKPRRVP
jgi:cytochrome b